MMPAPAVLVAHNFYRDPGGEDRVFETESALLESRGHRVVRYEEHNARIGPGNLISTGWDSIWSRNSYRKLEEIVRQRRPDVVHFHNTFPLISPSAYYAVQSQCVPVVQSLHNYRWLCLGATFFRDGEPCQDCLEKGSPWRGVAHGCYRKSRAESMAVASMLSYHRARATLSKSVDVLVVGSSFAKEQFVRGGVSDRQIAIKPNFVERDPGIGEGGGEYALFVGRLVEEKGIHTLLDAWERLPHIPLRIVGDGPLAESRAIPGVTWRNNQTNEQVQAEMKHARALVFPSTCYEVAPITILEAFAAGLPVIASNLGAMAGLVQHGRTGRLFRAGDAGDLAAQVRWVFDRPGEAASMRVAARREFEEKYTAERNYKMLMSIYEMATESARRRRRVAS